MEIGIFTQGYVRSDSTPQQRIKEVVELARVADEVGLASFGISEQHFKFPTNSTGPIAAIMAAVSSARSARRSTHTIVPDPYYGGPDGFELVLDLLEDSCEGLLAEMREALESIR